MERVLVHKKSTRIATAIFSVFMLVFTVGMLIAWILGYARFVKTIPYPAFLTPFLLRPRICLSLQPFSRQRRLRRALSTSQRRLGRKPTLTGISPASRQKCVRNAGYLLLMVAATGSWWEIGRSIAELDGDTIRVRSGYGLLHEWRHADRAIEDDPFDVTTFFLVHRPTSRKIQLPREAFAVTSPVNLRQRFA